MPDLAVDPPIGADVSHLVTPRAGAPAAQMPSETTALSPPDEQAFRQWAQTNGIENYDHPDAHYDMRGFWQATGGAPHPPGSEQHFPDTFKQHGHPTFSIESKYSTGPTDGGRWTGQNGDVFQPSPAASAPVSVDPPIGADVSHLTGRPPDFTGENAKDAQGHPIVDFLKGAAETALPSTTLNDYNFFDTRGGAGYAVRHPIDSAGLLLGAIKDAHVAQAQKTGDAYDRLTKATTLEDKLGAAADLFQHAAGTAVPVIGPAISSAVDTMRGGEIARGAGQLTGIAAPILAGKAATRLTPSLSTIADVADRGATAKMADVIAPTVGRQKLRFGQMAQDVAPTLARDPNTAALSRTGLAAKVEANLDTATQALDAAHDARNTRKPAIYATQPIVAALIKERDAIAAQPIAGAGGQPVVPPQKQAAFTALSTAIQNVQDLGPVASYDALRRLRMGYDQGAQQIYTPSVVDDFLTKRDAGLAWSKAAGSLRDFLASKDPATAAANANYALWRKASDVLQATEQTERARPSRFTQAVLSSSGMVTGERIGAAIGGPDVAALGAAAGLMLGPAVEVARSAGLTTQITTARLLARLADAIRSGKGTQALVTLKSLAATTGQTARFDALVKEGSIGSPARVPVPAAASAPVATDSQ